MLPVYSQQPVPVPFVLVLAPRVEFLRYQPAIAAAAAVVVAAALLEQNFAMRSVCSLSQHYICNSICEKLRAAEDFG